MRPLLVCGVVLLTATTARAGLLEDMEAWLRGPRYYAAIAQELKPLAEQGNAAAQLQLGLLYRKGRGVLEDYSEAMKWYRLSAEQGYGLAQYHLARLYRYGRGVPQDYAEAHKWYNLAAAALPPGEDRDKAVKGRNRVAKDMAPAQITDAQKLARDWSPKTWDELKKTLK